MPPPQQQWQQPHYPTPYQPPQKNKSRKGLFVILGVILAVAMFGCMGISAMVNAGGQAAQQTLNQTSTQVAQLPTTQLTTQPTGAPTTQPKVKTTTSLADTSTWRTNFRHCRGIWTTRLS